MKLAPIDRAALERAVEICRAENALQRARIDDPLAMGEDWNTVARSCSYRLQLEALQLAPWQTPPTYADPDALHAPHSNGEREAAELLARLMRAGLSKYEPDPVAALMRAERKFGSATKTAPTGLSLPISGGPRNDS